jgi:hypothetical protein
MEVMQEQAKNDLSQLEQQMQNALNGKDSAEQ